MPSPTTITLDPERRHAALERRHADLAFKYWSEVTASAAIFVAAIALTVTNAVVGVALLTTVVITRTYRRNLWSRLHGLEVVAFAAAVVLAPNIVAALCVVVAVAALAGTYQFARPRRA